MSLFPIAFASLHNISGRRWIAISAFWGGSYLLWLNIAYKLEFLGQEVFTPLWAASILFMLANTWVGGQFIRHRFMPEVLHAGPGIITLNNSAM
jgi:phosphatidylinositol glycan class M